MQKPLLLSTLLSSLVLSSLLLLTACSGTSSYRLGNAGNADDNKNDTEYMILNLPRAILASDPCKHGHPDDIAACRKKKQDEADHLNESLERN
ncbi:hypothetical protein [Shewanella inventionis]|uniref:EexN family lipoprotein n=1 Tax=Shewanella inventionis TaxID=1738770 RepID=A0ABQ1IKA0_9GAMM|nr:hypothetical protein [Shewanella inventionis]MCL1156395.1 hypothetical protein [Shewanella inventionis]GGB45195.1 hypothetical protein GCM10011607_01570 [Shewanella inventionis]